MARFGLNRPKDRSDSHPMKFCPPPCSQLQCLLLFAVCVFLTAAGWQMYRWHPWLPYHFQLAGLKLAAGATSPVLIAVRSKHYFGDGFERVISECSIPCEYRARPTSVGATAVWYHAPTSCGTTPERAFPGQVAVIASMESSAYYNCLDNAQYMSQFDIQMTYRLSSDIPTPYLRWDHVQNFARPPLPFANKSDALIYIQSNCDALSKRDDILKEVQKLGIALEARGKCLRNAPELPRWESKHDTMRQHKFCVTIENSFAIGYVSEKLWDGLSAGCLPIYYGSPDIVDHLPAPNAIIDYRALGESPERLATEIRRLASNESAYNETMAWRLMPLHKLGAGYQKLVAMTRLEHNQCRLCKLVAKIREQRNGSASNTTTVS